MEGEDVTIPQDDVPLAVALRDPTVQNKLQKFRDYINERGSLLNVRQDDIPALRFLKFNDYDMEKAEAMIIKNVNMLNNLPQFFKRMDIMDPVLNSLTRKGFIYKLPETDSEGNHVFIHIPRVLSDPATEGHGVALKSIALSLATAMEDETVDGASLVLDYSGCGLHLLSIVPVNDTKVFGLSAIKSTPLNFVAFHVVNVPSWAGWILRLALHFATRTIRHKIYIHKDWDSLKSVIPERILPKEYGGSVPEAEIIDGWISECMAQREKLLAVDEAKVAAPYRTKTYGFGGDSDESNKKKRRSSALISHFSKLQID